jgi:hypothetical protein
MPVSVLTNGYRGLCPEVRRSYPLVTNHHHQILTLRIHRLHFPHLSSWVVLNHEDNLLNSLCHWQCWVLTEIASSYFLFSYLCTRIFTSKVSWTFPFQFFSLCSNLTVKSAFSTLTVHAPSVSGARNNHPMKVIMRFTLFFSYFLYKQINRNFSTV